MSKIRRYDEGGTVDETDMDMPAKAMQAPSEVPADIKDISFGEAFRNARDAGLKTFSFKGKKFTTNMAPSTSAKSAVEAATRRRQGEEAAASSKFPRETKNSKMLTDDPRSNAYFQGRVNPKTLLPENPAMKRGGKVKPFAKGGSVTRGDGCAQRGKTKGRNC